MKKLIVKLMVFSTLFCGISCDSDDNTEFKPFTVSSLKSTRPKITVKNGKFTANDKEVDPFLAIIEIDSNDEFVPTLPILRVGDKFTTFLFLLFEGEADFKWFIADDSDGTNAKLIEGADKETYISSATLLGKYLGVEFKAEGVDRVIKSPFIGPFSEKE
ncbi:hypothetical protein [Aquimarina agarivorans]|uniref:hypothetical protein n=1 Tax=Aquimarina agarivorans TaxID=980584 RepID=UPI000248E974|nr:hypothetical protein [Aquimarina agarivorans]